MGLTLTTGAAGRERDRSDGGDEDVDIDDRPQV
jgi:hypothetical protein